MIFPRPQKLIANISEIEQISHKVWRYKFNMSTKLDFFPGQFTSVHVNKPLPWRSYSISSQPEKDFLETYVDVSPGGPGSRFFLASKEGDEVEMLVPLGRFVYEENNQPAVFICTGVGITPLNSMINYALKTLQTKRDVKLIFGVRHLHEIFLENDFNKLKENHSNFNFTYCVSQPESENPHFKGRVTDYIRQSTFDNSSIFYICGGKNMISDVETELTSQGVAEENIKFEQFY